MWNFISKIKFEKLVHLVDFIIRKFVAMHGHMNVKVCTANISGNSRGVYLAHISRRHACIIARIISVTEAPKQPVKINVKVTP
jgi:hypothetical protein